MWKYFNPIFEYEDEFSDVDEISAWVGHKYFIYDFIRNVKPKVITELGTHYGASFFSMCQAVKDGKLNSKLCAVDTWKGDKQSGFYDESVFIEVNKIKNRYYPKLKINLLRKTFNKAVNNFKNNSIDILHIDGLHTYKAVKHDFDNWFNKATEEGVIILHDTHEKKDDFEVYKLWEELKEKYKTLEFSHAHGLGILFKNPKPYHEIFNFQEIWQHYYPIIFENRNLKKEVNAINTQNTQLSQQLSQKSQENEKLKNQLEKTLGFIDAVKSNNEVFKKQVQDFNFLTKIFKEETERNKVKIEEIKTQLKEVEKDKNKRIKELENQLKQIRQEEQKRVEELERENELIRQQIEQTKHHTQNLESTLNMIKSAKFFKLWQAYCNIMKVLRLKS